MYFLRTGNLFTGLPKIENYIAADIDPVSVIQMEQRSAGRDARRGCAKGEF
ncbi:MAG: hypothetical protein LBR34_09670 [Prevotella sp.]|jgi:hypothetical protein|nr:hypothetical protein [Prevotella sp.]